VRLDTGEEVEGDALFLATGKYNLRGLSRPHELIGANPVVGFRTALAKTDALTAALNGVIELHLFDGGYAGLLLQEDGRPNLAVSVGRKRLKDAGGIEELVNRLCDELPMFGRRLDKTAIASWEAVAGVPYGWRARATEPGLFRLGDQAAVIASLAGDGIGIALTSGVASAAAFLADGRDGAQAFQSAFARRVARPLRIASTLRSVAENGTTRRPLLGMLTFVPSLASFAARLTRVAD
jgi:flavin-dependent dehydrogenase